MWQREKCTWSEDHSAFSREKTEMFLARMILVKVTHEREHQQRFSCPTLKTQNSRAGEMSQGLRVLTTLLEDQCLIPSSHKAGHNHL